MQTRLTDLIGESRQKDEVEAILRSCVHCGFCNAVCPTYQLTGDERDGPRGRIYLMKQALEGRPATRLTQRHLDRCLTCLSCETACPSGVRYGQLLEAGRAVVDREAGRSFHDALRRRLIVRMFSYRRRFEALLNLARKTRLLLPESLRSKIPPKPAVAAWPEPRHGRKMLILPGCVQQPLAPAIDVAAARVLDQLGVTLTPVSAGGCCGALACHLSEPGLALAFARQNIDACRPYLEQGAEAIVMTASACGVMAKDYGRLLRHDPVYAEEAARFSAAVKDVGEVLASEDLSKLKKTRKKIAFHSPCTLQHGQKLIGVVEGLLEQVGYQLTVVADPHLCCGSAGAYSLLQPEISKQLLTNKLKTLEAGRPDLIATANIGCLSYLQSVRPGKIVHWVELLS
ncbi:glycolate oxidase subunit GlcF [Methylosarcina fibrata]|uniref:glycolate oxidase subunit GlcF n=1 Tax=Methylosarcina fibrata TaxID=105972 RepID=UPI000376C534|nr:glycolate oxidase subunit GlcF [Methylosarcina fibrata]